MVASILIVIGIIALAGISGLVGYFTSEEIKGLIDGGIVFLKFFIDSIPQIFDFILLSANFLFSFIGFFITHIPLMFAITQTFFIFISMVSSSGKNKSFGMIETYLRLNRNLFSFIYHLMQSMIEIVISIIKALPFT